jgi:hypothetical protein
MGFNSGFKGLNVGRSVISQYFYITEMRGFELDSSVSLVDSFENSNEQLASVKYVKFLD